MSNAPAKKPSLNGRTSLRTGAIRHSDVRRRCRRADNPIGFWALGFPLSAFAALTLRLAMQFPQLQLIGMVSLAVASVVTVLLAMATWKGVREGSLLQAEPVAIVAVPGSGQPPGPQ